MPGYISGILAQLQHSIYKKLAETLSSLPGNRTVVNAVPQAGDPGQFAELIRSASERNGLDPALVTAVVQAESSFNPIAVSSAGAKGLMQLMDSTARTLGVANTFDPVQNIEGGTRFLRSLLDRYGRVDLALAAYNAGPNAVDRFGGVPPYAETQTYVSRVLGLRDQYRQWEA